jgi:hypothetical protein
VTHLYVDNQDKTVNCSTDVLGRRWSFTRDGFWPTANDAGRSFRPQC